MYLDSQLILFNLQKNIRYLALDSNIEEVVVSILEKGNSE